MGNKMRRVALGLMALSMRLDTYVMQRGLTMDASYPKDPDPKNWRTINGSKVHLTEGKIDGGAGGKFSGKAWTGKTKHEFTPKEKPKQEETKATAKSKVAPKPKKATVGMPATEFSLFSITSCATSNVKKIPFDDPMVSGNVNKLKKLYKLDDKDVAAIGKVYEDLQNKKINPHEFKSTVNSILQNGAPEEAKKAEPVKNPVKFTLGQLQTKGLLKTKLTKATTGVSTPKGTLGLYAVEGYKGVSDPAFKNFEEQYGSKQTAKYEKQEKESVYFYTNDSKPLRDFLCYGKASGWGNFTKEKLQEHADNISAGLAKMEHPNMWVFRKCSLMDWATKDNPNGATFEALKKMQKDGTVFTNAAFLSSTPADGGTFGDSQLVRHFFVPKKAKGGYIKSVSQYENEMEFLLDKGTKTRIMKVEKHGDKIITYEEVVLDD